MYIFTISFIYIKTFIFYFLYFKDDNEFTKAWKFLKRVTQTFLQRHAIQFPLTNIWGAKVDGFERTFTGKKFEIKLNKF